MPLGIHFKGGNSSNESHSTPSNPAGAKKISPQDQKVKNQELAKYLAKEQPNMERYAQQIKEGQAQIKNAQEKKVEIQGKLEANAAKKAEIESKMAAARALLAKKQAEREAADKLKQNS